MTLASRPQREVEFFDRLRARYEAEGFTFTVDPGVASLPDSLGTYRPDAIAQRAGQHFAIEVINREASGGRRSLVELQKLFAHHPDWKLVFVHVGDDENGGLSIPTSSAESIRSRLDEIAGLDRSGHRRAAFVLAWSLLEAALHALSGKSSNPPRTAGATVQWLATNGHIEPELERRLRELTKLRNRVAHGDLTVEPEHHDVQLVLSAIDAALTVAVG